jgi:hypothetical protein
MFITTRLRRMLKRLITLAAILNSCLVATPASAAQETGLHKIHAVKMMGGKLCMTEHEHAGESPPSGSKAVAMKLAVNKWILFTADEYGKRWGSYAAAVGKKESCTGAAGNVVCLVVARPCRSK